MKILHAEGPAEFSLKSSSDAESLRARCHPFGDGIFVLAQRSVQASLCDPKEPESDWSYDITYVLKFIDKDGKVTTPWEKKTEGTDPDAWKKQFSKISLRQSKSCSSDDESVDANLFAVYDLDKDGNPELLTREHSEICGCMGGPSTNIQLLTLGKDGSLSPYVHTPPHLEPWSDEETVKDVDNDGRIDFPSRGPYEKLEISDCGAGNSIPLVPQVFVHHGLPDGRFSNVDEVSQNALRKFCPSRPDIKHLTQTAAKAFIEKNSADSVVQDVVCARAWGATPAELLGPLRSACRAWWIAQPGHDDDDPQSVSVCESFYDATAKDCADWLLKLVAIEPIIHLK